MSKNSSLGALKAIVLGMSFGISALSVAQNELQIPDLGGGASSIISPAQERTLGDTWLRMFRAQAPTIEDPLLYAYTDKTLTDLAAFSQLRNRDLSLVIVDNTSINAFAVPGGVIGINTGLYIAAREKGQFVSVLAHELAHLSQNHFQRRVEQQQQAAIPMFAALLASIALAAATGGDAGAAAIMATQAAAQQNALRYSRAAESEADRIGLITMQKAGYDPNAMGEMFDIMKRQQMSSGNRPPEYLLSHPLSENRAADAKLRARQYSPKMYRLDLYYQFMRARALVLSTENPNEIIGTFEKIIADGGNQKNAGRYGLSLALTKAKDFDNAQMFIDQIEPESSQIALLKELAQVELLRTQELYDDAETLLANLKIKHTGNFAIDYLSALNLYDQRNYLSALDELEILSVEHNNNSEVWFMLAETYGLAGDIVGVHKARAEWFALNGAFSLATRQLSLALRLMENENYHLIEISRTQERMKAMRELQTEAEQL